MARAGSNEHVLEAVQRRLDEHPVDASDLINALRNTLQGGGRPHMENRRERLSLLKLGEKLQIFYASKL